MVIFLVRLTSNLVNINIQNKFEVDILKYVTKIANFRPNNLNRPTATLAHDLLIGIISF